MFSGSRYLHELLCRDLLQTLYLTTDGFGVSTEAYAYSGRQVLYTPVPISSDIATKVRSTTAHRQQHILEACFRS